MTVHSDEVGGRVRRLLEFLRETVSAQSKPVRAYGPTTRLEWLYQRDRDVQVDVNATAGDVVVRVVRVSVEPPPQLPDQLVDAVQGPIDRTAEPPTLTRGAGAIESEAFRSWLIEWQVWAADDAKKRPLAELYLSVDRMREESHTQPETVEVVLASGLLSATVSGVSIDSHLVTQPVEVTRDEDTGDLLVKLTAGSSPRLEDRQLLLGLEGLYTGSATSLAQKLGDVAGSPIASSASAILKEWSNSAISSITYVANRHVPPAARRGTVRESPALLLRRRTGFALVSYYDAMIAALNDGADIPLGLQQLVESIESTDRLDWLARPNSEPTPEILFPLAANRAQSSIMEKLSLDTGVVVEGPPGTGKTHTIANLMSALLAQGQRVLVTSEKSQALRVLRDKLPAELQDLCVSITDLAKGGSEELDHSVSVIAGRLADFEIAQADRHIERIAGERYRAINKKYTLEEALTSTRSDESEVRNFGSHYDGTMSGVALQLAASAAELAWVPGPLYTESPPITSAQFAELAKLLVESELHAADRREQSFPDLSTVLPSKTVVTRLCDGASSRASVSALADVPTAELRRLAALSRQVLARCTQLDGDLRAVLEGVLSGSLGYLWTRASEASALLDDAKSADAVVGTANVVVDRVDLVALETYRAAARLYTEGRFDTLRWFRTPKEQTAVDELGATATVDGVPAQGAQAYRLVAEHIRALRSVDEAASLLADIGIRLPGRESRAARINEVDGAVRNVALVQDVVERIATISDELEGRVALRTLDGVEGLLSDIEKALAGANARDALERLVVIADSFEAATGGANSAEALALSDALRTADREAFDAAVRGYARASVEQQQQLSMDALLEDLDAAAPTLGHLVTSDRVTDWVVVSRDFEDAWAWRWANQHVEQGLVRPEASILDDLYDDVDGEISQLTATLAAEKAWRECLQRMTSREMQALHTYQESISNIGVGRTKIAQRYRASARAAMQEAQSAVPAWIMPIGQVLSSIPPQQNVFDVVIVDEASQADISSLFLMWLAPRVIVVGDDKQCAPDRIQQVSDDTVFERLDSHLGDLPMHVRNNFSPRSSLFSLLRSRYNQRVRLREHFRSMPEIIEWSSKQFYRDTPLIPVRQFGAERLQPLVSTYVEGAETTGSSATLVNEIEARGLVERLCECISDPDYDGMTFGVVVLQSRAQVELIRSLISERIPAEQRDNLRLRVGTAPEFQGDERDVVFVSMVVGAGSSSNALTNEMWQRRFNVAASRARDQLWLFHSVRAGDLSPLDLRASLLTYVEAAPTVPVPEMPQVVDEEALHSDFVSMTAQRVFVALRDRGYHVNSAIEINELVLDLVVTGVASKVAIECDDDRRRSRDVVVERLRREMDLKRCGWTFGRVRASQVVVDVDTALAPIIEILDAVGILPGEVEIADAGRDASWKPVVLSANSSEDAPPDEGPVTPAPVVDTVVAPLPTVIEEKYPVRSTSVQVVELEPGETRPPKFDGSVEIRVDSRYSTPRRSTPVKRVPVTTRPSPAVMPKRAPSKKPVVPPAPAAAATAGVGIETLPAAVQAALASLPAASLSTGRVIAVAAARRDSPLTLRRCSLITGMTPIAAQQLLADLELTKKLVRRHRRNGVAEWVRPEDAAS